MAVRRTRRRLALSVALTALAGAAAAQEAAGPSVPPPADPIDAILQQAPAPAAETPAVGTPPPQPVPEPISTAPEMSEDEAEEGPSPPLEAPSPAAPPEPRFAAPPVTPPPVATAPVAPSPAAPPPYVPSPPPQARPYSPFPGRPAATAARPSTSGAPVHIDEAGRTPDGPPRPVDIGYESRLRSSFASAQGLQGPLDGRWTLSADGGTDLYSLQLVDNGMSALEGAWRDVRRTGAIEGSGFLADIQRTGPGLVFRFYPQPGGAVATASLTMGGDGRWAGELDEGGRRRAVTLRRN